MSKIAKSLIVAAGLLPGLAAHAQSNAYFGANVSLTEYKEDNFPKAEPKTIGLLLGAKVNPYLAIEARLGGSLSDDTVSTILGPTTFKLKNYYGAYVRGIAPLSDRFSAYGLLGYANGKVTVSSALSSVTVSDSNVSYGIGGEWALTRSLSANLEWARLFSGDRFKVNALTLGLNVKF